MKRRIERLLIAANMSMDAQEREEFKRKLFEDLRENHPEVLEQLEYVL